MIDMPTLLEIIREYDGSPKNAASCGQKLAEACEALLSKEGNYLEIMAGALKDFKKADYQNLAQLIKDAKIYNDPLIIPLATIAEKAGLEETEENLPSVINQSHAMLEKIVNSYIHNLESALLKLGERKKSVIHITHGAGIDNIRAEPVRKTPGNTEVYDAIVANIKAAKRLEACFIKKSGKTEEEKTKEIINFSAEMRSTDANQFTNHVQGWEKFCQKARLPINVAIGRDDNAEKIALAELERIENHIYHAHRTLYANIGTVVQPDEKKLFFKEVTKTDAEQLSIIQSAKLGKITAFDALANIVAIAQVAAAHNHRGRFPDTQLDYESYRLITGAKLFDPSQVAADAKKALGNRAIEFDQYVFNAREAREEKIESKKTMEQIAYDRFSQGILLEQKYLTRMSEHLNKLSELAAEAEAKGQPFDHAGLELLKHTFERMITSATPEEMNYYKKDFIKITNEVCSPTHDILSTLGANLKEDATNYSNTHFKLVSGLNEKNKQLYTDIFINMAASMISPTTLALNLPDPNLIKDAGSAGTIVIREKLAAKLKQPPRSDSEAVILTIERIKNCMRNNKLSIAASIGSVIAMFVCPLLLTYKGTATLAFATSRMVGQRLSMEEVRAESRAKKTAHDKERLQYLIDVVYPKRRELKDTDPATYLAFRTRLLRDIATKTSPEKQKERTAPIELKPVGTNRKSGS